MNGSGGLPGSEERKRTKIRSDGLQTNGRTKICLWASKDRRMKKPKNSSGGLPKNEKPKDSYPTVPSALDF
ncbi:unnamed protein product [Rhizophagus irregularis]|nr:unnamed protein product [Rhizophagus irregularis]